MRSLVSTSPAGLRLAATLPPVSTPTVDAESEPLDLIFIDGMLGQTVIGIHDSELHRPQPLLIDVCAGVPRTRACDTDRISDTIDYGTMRTRL